ncbi:PKD domain-containing protein [Halarchaeum sp. P4]|uniref:PKD domain-containing protein n=1 Tax=Halarchaeum sp. P4 TaxID=3421639 RepID=UPI003EB76898
MTTTQTGGHGATRLLVSLLVVASVVAAGFGAGGVAAASGTSSSAPSAPIAVYADDSGALTYLYANGTATSLGVTGVSVVGRLADLDGDDALEAPYVTSDGALRIVDASGDAATLATSAKTGKTAMATGDWDGDGRTSVFYVNASDGVLYRASGGTTPTAVSGPDGGTLAANAVVGVADYDDNGTTDLLYLGSSSTLKYYDGRTLHSTGFSSFGSNNGLGVGAPADFDGDGVPRVPYVTGGQTLSLLAANGSKTPVSFNQTPAKAPVAPADWTDDGRPDVLYVGSDNGHLQYAALGGPSGAVTGADGTPRSVTVGVGVASAAAQPEPTITEFALTNPEGRTLRVAFTSDERLATVNVTVSGPENATLTTDEFNASGDGPYRYTASTTVGTDGNYTATLRTAADETGADGADGQTASVRVATPHPSVSNATLRTPNASAPVGINGTVEIAATVRNESALRAVTANASALDAGTVTLERANASTDVYAATVTLGPDATTGSVSLVVRATNTYGHTGTATTNALAVDTGVPRADAGPNITVTAGTVVGFDGDGSIDDGRLVRYRWTFGDGTNETGVNTTHTYEQAGTYTATLAVVDAAGNRDSDTRTVTVRTASDSEGGDDTRVVYVGGGGGESGSTGDGGSGASEPTSTGTNTTTTTNQTTTTVTDTATTSTATTTTNGSVGGDTAERTTASDGRADRTGETDEHSSSRRELAETVLSALAALAALGFTVRP